MTCDFFLLILFLFFVCGFFVVVDFFFLIFFFYFLVAGVLGPTALVALHGYGLLRQPPHLPLLAVPAAVHARHLHADHRPAVPQDLQEGHDALRRGGGPPRLGVGGRHGLRKPLRLVVS